MVGVSEVLKAYAEREARELPTELGWGVGVVALLRQPHACIADLAQALTVNVGVEPLRRKLACIPLMDSGPCSLPVYATPAELGVCALAQSQRASRRDLTVVLVAASVVAVAGGLQPCDDCSYFELPMVAAVIQAQWPELSADWQFPLQRIADPPGTCRPSTYEQSSDDDATSGSYDQRRHPCRAERAAIRHPEADPLRAEYHPSYMDWDAEVNAAHEG